MVRQNAKMKRLALGNKGIVAALLLGVVVTGCSTVNTAVPERDDWPKPGAYGPMAMERGALSAPGWDGAVEQEQRSSLSSELGIFELGWRVYSRGLTEIDGPRCEHRPTCSVYAHRAVRKHGPVVGMFMSVDRLMRGSQSSALRRLPIYRIEEGMIYYYDPVEANDFFF